MDIKTWALLVAAGLAAGCATPTGSTVGTGNGRFLVLRDFGMAYAQMETASPQVCAQLRTSYSKALVPGGSQKLDCENVDQSQNLPYSLSVSDTTGPVLVTTFNRALCTSWEGMMKAAPGVKVEPGGCQQRPGSATGKRYFQVRDVSGGVFAQVDFGTEANCQQFEKIRAGSATQPQGSTQFVCTDESRSRDMQYSVRVVSQNNLPVLEMEAHDKDFCEVMARGLGSQYPGYRPECKFNR